MAVSLSLLYYLKYCHVCMHVCMYLNHEDGRLAPDLEALVHVLAAVASRADQAAIAVQLLLQSMRSGYHVLSVR